MSEKCQNCRDNNSIIIFKDDTLEYAHELIKNLEEENALLKKELEEIRNKKIDLENRRLESIKNFHRIRGK